MERSRRIAGGKCRFPDLFGLRTERVLVPTLALVLAPALRSLPPVVMGRSEPEKLNGDMLVLDGT
eukprot:CAMPEP_0182525842 /NCGR_PEP_ID=MMETSP1323-20130603/2762_1 /TAXON_ID=236787 /ORGANISM="Florenciella parvula, Strain RCC1693" /LENGTH=64 /DNA_ID=CAMNT_0024734607 /DNA_START=158 /DNA_END=352 /DNA_ORIENTATION=-